MKVILYYDIQNQIKTLVIIIDIEVIVPQNFDVLGSCLMLKKKKYYIYL